MIHVKFWEPFANNIFPDVFDITVIEVPVKCSVGLIPISYNSSQNRAEDGKDVARISNSLGFKAADTIHELNREKQFFLV